MNIGRSTTRATITRKMAAVRAQTRIRRFRTRNLRAAMASAALSLIRLVFGLLVPLGAGGADGPPRSAPTRPGTAAARAATPSPATAPLSSRRIAGREYVSVADVASRLRLTLTWVE